MIATPVGTFTTTDPDSGETHHYTILPGGTDDTAFAISGQQLVTARPLDYEATPNTFTVNIRTTDKDGLTFDQEFQIEITNVNEAPTAVDDDISPSEQVFVGTGASIDVLHNDTDPDADTELLVHDVGAPDHGATSRDNEFVYFDPPDDENGVAHFTYTVSDGDPIVALTDEGTVTVTYVADDPRGDCNADGAVNAADFVSTILEYFDTEDAEPWWETYAEGFAGSPQGCDSNADTYTDISDLICTVRVFFGDTCEASTAAASSNPPLVYWVVSETDEEITASIRLRADSTQIAALAFELRFDPDQLQPLDDDGGDVPLPEGISTWVNHDSAEGVVQVALAAVTFPIVPLPSGDLITLHFARKGAGTPSIALQNVSASTTEGASLFVTLIDGEAADPARILLPMTRR